MMQENAAAGRKSAIASRPYRELQRRLVSGLFLGLLALALLLAGPRPFALLVLFVALMMSWEWGRVVRSKRLDISFLVHSSAACSAAVLAAVGQPILGLAAVLIGAVFLIILNFGKPAYLSILGVAYVGLPAISLIWLRSNEPWGVYAVLYILILVAAADTAAFVGGKLVGGVRLWPSISPNKTWAGLLSAILAAGIVGATFALTVTEAKLAYAVPIALALGLVSQMGDLAESALKRGHGVKDASDLIPGHGGFLDRMDGLVAVGTAAGLMTLLLNANAPSHALLFGP